MTIPALFAILLSVRLVSLIKSISNEKKLKKAGAKEYGKINSLMLTLAHVAFYFSCLYEAIYFQKVFNTYSFTGLMVFIFSMVVLWIVIYSLKDIWTVKLIIAPYHPVNQSFLFKYFRHPNYFLNVLPELLGISLVCQSWYTLAIGLPIYLIPLTIRIFQEEKTMKANFGNY